MRRALAAFLWVSSLVADAALGGTSHPVVTVYAPPAGDPAGGFAWVEEQRAVAVVPGRNRIAIEPLPSGIDASSLRVLVGGDSVPVRPLVQSFHPGVGERQSILALHLGRAVRVLLPGQGGQWLEGTLIETSPRVVVRDAEGTLHILSNPRRMEVGASDVVPWRPALIWEVEAERAGTLPVLLRYETSGLSWHAEYALTLEPDENESRGRMELVGAFFVENRTDVSWSDAQLSLVAGDVHRLPPRVQPPMFLQRELSAAMKSADGVQPQPAGPYYEYALPYPVSLAAAASVRLEGIGPFGGVPYEQEYVCRHRETWNVGTRGGPILEREPGGGKVVPVEVFLRFHNQKKSGLGIPLPAGVARIGQRRRGAMASWRFLGAAELPHTPAGEAVVLPVGTAFDVVAERTAKDFTASTEQRRLEEEIAVEVRNQKEKPVQVRVLETMYRAPQWEILGSDVKFSKKDARTIEFLVDVPAKGRTSLTYRVRYTW